MTLPGRTSSRSALPRAEVASLDLDWRLEKSPEAVNSAGRASPGSVARRFMQLHAGAASSLQSRTGERSTRCSFVAQLRVIAADDRRGHRVMRDDTTRDVLLDYNWHLGRYSAPLPPCPLRSLTLLF